MMKNYTVASLKDEIEMEKLNLEVHKLVGTTDSRIKAAHSLCDARIKLMFLEGDLSDEDLRRFNLT